MIEEKRKEILERLEKAGLLFESIHLSGIYKEIVVHEVTGHSARLIGQLSIEIGTDDSLSEDVKDALFALYIPLTACSQGDVPDCGKEQGYQNFFDMKDSDIETWTRTARKLNPQIFNLLDLQEAALSKYLTAEELAKKKPKPTTNTNGKKPKRKRSPKSS